jgi:hypothetical protein
MHPDDFAKLHDDIQRSLLAGHTTVGILGLTPVTLKILDELDRSGLAETVKKIHVPKHEGNVKLSVPVATMEELVATDYDLLIVAADAEKEDLLLAALPYISGTPKVIVSGYGHLSFRDDVFEEELRQLLVPSIANGYPNSLVHLYQCLINASRLGLRGVVAEFGMFKGGTTMFLARVIERLGQSWKVFGFDTFEGFPARRSPLDMYAHPDCVFTDLDSVRRYISGSNIEIVAGDIVRTASPALNDKDIVLSFVDTDNYSSAAAALDVIQERTVVGGAIVFDHFTGTDKFRYTLGERMAGRRLLEDARYFHLHGTGVFYRQR